MANDKDNMELNAWKIAESKRISELSVFQILDEVTDFETGSFEDDVKTRFTQKKLTKQFAKKLPLI